MRFKKYKIEDLYNISSGLSKSRKEFGFGNPFLTFKEVFHNYFLPNELENLANTNDKEQLRCSIKKGDIFLTRTSETSSELGMSSVALKDYDNATFNGFTKRLRLKNNVNNIVSPLYIGYYLRSRKFRTQITNIASMTTRASLNNMMLNSFEIEIPVYEIQEKIGQILKAFDEKIEVNRQMNATLEAMAQAMFREMCLPKDENSLEEGWELRKIGDLTDTISNTYKFKEIEEIIFLNTSDVSKGFVQHHNYRPTKGLPGQAKKRIQKGDILYSEIRPKNRRYAYVDFEAEDYVVSTKLMVLRSNDIVDTMYIYFYLTRSKVIARLQQLAESRSGTFPQITFKQLKDIEIPIPTDDILNQFLSFLKPVYEKIYQNHQENQELAKSRDLLLPKLMNGEIEV